MPFYLKMTMLDKGFMTGYVVDQTWHTQLIYIDGPLLSIGIPFQETSLDLIWIPWEIKSHGVWGPLTSKHNQSLALVASRAVLNITDHCMTSTEIGEQGYFGKAKLCNRTSGRISLFPRCPGYMSPVEFMDTPNFRTGSQEMLWR